MSNDNKTLADVQPGGRVRLGDALLPCPFCGEPLTINGAGDGVHQRDSDCILAQYVVVADHAPHAAAWNRRSLSAQPSPGGQGDLKSRFTEWVKANGYNPATFASGRFMGDGVQIAWEAVQALAAPQPAGEPVGEPVEHDCTNCDRKHAEVICPTCAGIAWDNGRLHEFHEVRELSTSLGEGVLDHLLPDEWHEKPLLRFQGAYDEGDDSVGISPRSANVLAEDKTGTVLGDYLAARQPVGEPVDDYDSAFQEADRPPYLVDAAAIYALESFLTVAEEFRRSAEPYMEAINEGGCGGEDEVSEAFDTQLARAKEAVSRAVVYAALPAQAVDYQAALLAEERSHSETIDQRDRCEEVADELADHIARITGVDIGEHSSANCPWQNAIEAAEEYKPAQAVDLGAVRSLLERRIAQWRSHLPADPGAPGTREIQAKGEHDYNNDVRIYREGIAVMAEVLHLIDSQGAR